MIKKIIVIIIIISKGLFVCLFFVFQIQMRVFFLFVLFDILGTFMCTCAFVVVFFFVFCF